MDDQSDARNQEKANPWPSMALFSTLLTAVALHRAIKERKAGRDPSAQEALSTARSYLEQAMPEVRLLLTRLQIHRVSNKRAEVAQDGVLVRRFPRLMMISQLVRLLHTIHQRLMSMYPAVPAALVEEARLLQVEANALVNEDPARFEQTLGRFIEHGFRFLDQWAQTHGG